MGFIQTAIDAAGAGTTITLAAGTDVDGAIVNKALTIKGAAQLATIIDGGVFEIQSNDVHIDGVHVKNSGGTGIGVTDWSVTPRNNCSVKNCKVESCVIGIQINGNIWTVDSNEIIKPDKGAGNDADYMRIFGDSLIITCNWMHDTSLALLCGVGATEFDTQTCAHTDGSQNFNNSGAVGGVISNITFAFNFIGDSQQAIIWKNNDGDAGYDSFNVHHNVFYGEALGPTFWFNKGITGVAAQLCTFDNNTFLFLSQGIAFSDASGGRESSGTITDNLFINCGTEISTVISNDPTSWTLSGNVTADDPTLLLSQINALMQGSNGHPKDADAGWRSLSTTVGAGINWTGCVTAADPDDGLPDPDPDPEDEVPPPAGSGATGPGGGIGGSNDLGEARLRFIEVTGRLDLLKDGNKAANVDNGADVFLNRAQKRLDRRAHFMLPTTRHSYLMPTNMPLIEVPNLIAIQSLQYMDKSATNPTFNIITGNRKATIDELLEDNSKILSEQTGGPPSAWVFNPSIQSPWTKNQTSFDEIIGSIFGVDTEIHMSKLKMETTGGSVNMLNTGTAVDWATGLNADSTEGFFSYVKGVGTAASMVIDPTHKLDINKPFITPVQGRRYRIHFKTRTAPGAIGDLLVSVFGGPTKVIHASTMVVGAKFDLDLIGGTNGDKFITFNPDTVIGSFQIFTFGSDNVADKVSISEIAENTLDQKVILVSPKPDKDYVIKIIGTFESPKLNANADQSYWTVNYLDILVYKAVEIYYIGLSNSARAKHFRDAVDNGIQEIDDCLAAEEMSGMDMEPVRGVF